MKKNSFDPYAKYHYKQKQKKSTNNSKSKVLAILFVVLSLAVVIFFSISFSNFLLVGKVVNINNSFVSTPKKVFALSLNSTMSKGDATQKAEQQQLQGGAGYVLEINGNYQVISSIYPTQNECDKVRNALLAQNPNAQTICLTLPQVVIKSNFSSAQSQSLNNSLNMFYSTYLSLYNLSNQYDTQKIDQITLKTSIQSLKEQNQKVIQDFQKSFSQSSVVAIIYAKIYLNKTNQVISNLLLGFETQISSSSLKKAYTSVIDLYLSFCDEIN